MTVMKFPDGTSPSDRVLGLIVRQRTNEQLTAVYREMHRLGEKAEMTSEERTMFHRLVLGAMESASTEFLHDMVAPLEILADSLS